MGLFCLHSVLLFCTVTKLLQYFSCSYIIGIFWHQSGCNRKSLVVFVAKAKCFSYSQTTPPYNVAVYYGSQYYATLWTTVSCYTQSDKSRYKYRCLKPRKSIFPTPKQPLHSCYIFVECVCCVYFAVVARYMDRFASFHPRNLATSQPFRIFFSKFKKSA